MIIKLVICITALTLVTLVQGNKHDELLANGYQYIPGVGYYYYGAQLSHWTTAQKNCTSSKARLAVINSEEERQAIVSLLIGKPKYDVYMGFTNKNETQYVTTEGIPLNYSGYTEWYTGYPSDGTDLCGAIFVTTGELISISCANSQAYLCEHQLWFDYTFIEGIGSYMLHVDGRGWADAYSVCKSEGAHLLVINSQAEADAVMRIYNEHPNLNADSNDSVFIGFRAVMDDLSNDPYSGTFLTVLGTSVSDLGYVKWSGNEPQVASYKFCGTLNRSDASYVMNSCNSRFAFFCEKELEQFKRS